MPAWFLGIGAWLSRLVSTRIGYWIGAAFAFLGIQYVASEFVTEPLMAQIQSAFTGAPADLAAWLSFLNVDRYITIIMSAYATAAAAGALRLRKK